MSPAEFEASCPAQRKRERDIKQNGEKRSGGAFSFHFTLRSMFEAAFQVTPLRGAENLRALITERGGGSYLQLGGGGSRVGNDVRLGEVHAGMGSTNRVDVKGDEETVQQVICEDCVEGVDLKAEDVVQVVKVVQVLGHEVFEPIETSMAEKHDKYACRTRMQYLSSL